MRRWQWEIRRAADAAETYRHYLEDWDESGDREVYPPVHRASFGMIWDCTRNDSRIDDVNWGREAWDMERMRYRCLDWRWALWAWLRTTLGVAIAVWERWREPEWLKDPNTVLYFKRDDA